MNSIAHAIQQFFAGAADSLTPFLTALSVIGVATMAILQTVKDLTPLRRYFQAASLNNWLLDGTDEARTRFTRALAELGIEQPDAARAREQLVRLSVDGDDHALFDLSIEQMCGQMNSAVQLALDYPDRYPDLLLVAASGADVSDVRQLFGADRLATIDVEAGIATKRIFLADARNRVVHQLQRAIDGFQIKTAFRWKWWLQVASFGVSVALALVAIAWSTDVTVATQIGPILLTAVFAGFLAPVARDLTAVLQKFRG